MWDWRDVKKYFFLVSYALGEATGVWSSRASCKNSHSADLRYIATRLLTSPSSSVKLPMACLHFSLSSSNLSCKHCISYNRKHSKNHSKTFFNWRSIKDCSLCKTERGLVQELRILWFSCMKKRGHKLMHAYKGPLSHKDCLFNSRNVNIRQQKEATLPVSSTYRDVT